MGDWTVPRNTPLVFTSEQNVEAVEVGPSNFLPMDKDVHSSSILLLTAIKKEHHVRILADWLIRCLINVCGTLSS